MRKKTPLIVTITLLTLLGPLALAPPSGAIEVCDGRTPSAEPVGVAPPSIIYDITGKQIWVSAVEARNNDGSLNLDLLGEEYEYTVEGIRMQPVLTLEEVTQEPYHSFPIRVENPGTRESEIWLYYGWTSDDDLSIPEDPTLELLGERANAIFLGEVVGVTPGFFYGYAATLLTVEVQRATVFGHRVPEDAERIYLYYPKACFSIGDSHYWKGNAGYPPPPDVGTKILVTTEAGSPSVDWEGPGPEPFIVYPEAAGLFFESGEGQRARMPQAEALSQRTAGWSLDAMMTEMIRSRDSEE